MASESKTTHRRALWAAVGYVPALVAIAGPLYLAARLGVDRALAHSSLTFASRRLAASGLADLVAAPLVLTVTWAYLRLCRAGGLTGLGLAWKYGAPWALAAGAAIAAAAMSVVFGLDLALGGSVVRGTNPAVPWFLLAALGSATRAGWTEEIVCRGVLLQQLERGLNRPLAVILSTAVFVLPHVNSSAGHGPIRWVGVTLIGLTLVAAYYIAGRNLWLPIGLHWATDLWVYVLLGRYGEYAGVLRWQPLPTWLSGTTDRVDWLLVGSLPVLWLALAAWWAARRRLLTRIQYEI